MISTWKSQLRINMQMLGQFRQPMQSSWAMLLALHSPVSPSWGKAECKEDSKLGTSLCKHLLQTRSCCLAPPGWWKLPWNTLWLCGPCPHRQTCWKHFRNHLHLWKFYLWFLILALSCRAPSHPPPLELFQKIFLKNCYFYISFENVF